MSVSASAVADDGLRPLVVNPGLLDAARSPTPQPQSPPPSRPPLSQTPSQPPLSQPPLSQPLLPAPPPLEVALETLPPTPQALPPAEPPAELPREPLPEARLRGTPRLTPQVRDERYTYPSFIAADRMQGTQDVETIAEGMAQMRTLGRSVDADQLHYRLLEDEVEATGNVLLLRDDDVVRGPKMRLKLEDNVGYFEQPQYSLSRLPLGGAAAGRPPVRGSGAAARLEFEGEGAYRLKNATYSTCSAHKLDWFAEVDELSLDYNTEVARATNARVIFGGVPILYSPWLSFSLNNQRKTGLLAPTIGSTSQGGLDYTQPWYWNIAPNLDATIAPRWIERRGVQMNSEIRYLSHNYSGQINNQYLPNDKIYRDDRFAYSVVHNHNLGAGFSAAVNYSAVSDYRYFSELSTRLALVSQTYMLQQGGFAYSGGWWGANVTATRYQAPTDHGRKVLPGVYSRLPQATFYASRADLPLGLAMAGTAEYVEFTHPTAVMGQRWMAYPQISLPITTTAFNITPKIGVHASRYHLQKQAPGALEYFDRAVPIASLDMGVALERETEWQGKPILHTLEPRLYYVNIPHRDQSQIPVFDSAAAGYDFAQIFTENRYSGSDRIGDANQLTGMVTSRLIDQSTGTETLRAAVGQRYYFRDQTVTLPGEVARPTRTADLLMAVSGQAPGRKAFLDSSWQYNPHERRTERFTVGARYQPELGKVLNAGYRFTAAELGQIDISGQWPVGGGWTGMGRYNYSTRDGRIIEALGGIEYNAGCWAARVVTQRIATQDNSSNTAIFFQLELTGFSSIGSNPTGLLMRNIPGYGRADHSTSDPMFSAN